MNRQAWLGIAPGAALAGIALSATWLEQRMVTHMVIELPLIFIIGWWAASTHGRGPAWLRAVNVSGLTGLSLATVVSAVWMLPLSLDAAVLDPMVGWLKVCSILLAGWLTRISLREARPAVQGFFLLNWAWMTSAGGALYQQAPERLCSTYLQGDQAWAGLGLVALVVVVVASWMVLAFRDRRDPAPPFPPLKSP